MFVSGGVARLFQSSAACVTVGAVGPNAQHFLHAMNFGSMSPWIQTSAPPQNGQGRSGCTEPGYLRSGSLAALSPVFPGMLMQSSFSHRHRGNAELVHFESAAEGWRACQYTLNGQANSAAELGRASRHAYWIT